jgi:CRP-like cAMP-binding protein
MTDEEASLGKDYKDGDTIFEENSIGKEMYIILTGNAKVIRKKDGVETTLATLEEGDFFGEMSLFDNSPPWKRETFLERCHCSTIAHVLLP